MWYQCNTVVKISIHALLAESDPRIHSTSGGHRGISIHALLAESDAVHIGSNVGRYDFYPRSPCGERQRLEVYKRPYLAISIHALLAESDMYPSQCRTLARDFYPRSPCGERPYYMQWDITDTVISIHALLAESDGISGPRICSGKLFLSTLSLRRATR